MADAESKKPENAKPDSPRKVPSNFVSKIVPDPANPPDVFRLTGYPGASTEEGSIRLYANAELSAYWDIPEADVLHEQPVSHSADPLGAVTLWIKRDSKIISHPGNEGAQSAMNTFSGVTPLTQTIHTITPACHSPFCPPSPPFTVCTIPTPPHPYCTLPSPPHTVCTIPSPPHTFCTIPSPPHTVCTHPSPPVAGCTAFPSEIIHQCTPVTPFTPASPFCTQITPHTQTQTQTQTASFAGGGGAAPQGITFTPGTVTTLPPSVTACTPSPLPVQCTPPPLSPNIPGCVPSPDGAACPPSPLPVHCTPSPLPIHCTVSPLPIHCTPS